MRPDKRLAGHAARSQRRRRDGGRDALPERDGADHESSRHAPERGSLGGQAATFTYDLARSVVYTRQANPAWAGQERDGIAPKRSDDLF